MFRAFGFYVHNWYFVTKIVLPTMRKNCSGDQEKLFEAKGQEFAKDLRSLE